MEGKVIACRWQRALHATWKELKLLEWNALAFLLATWQNAALGACLGDECWMAANRHSYWITNPITNNTAESWGVPDGGGPWRGCNWHHLACCYCCCCCCYFYCHCPQHPMEILVNFWRNFPGLWDCLNLLKHFSHYTDDTKLWWFISISSSFAACTTWRMSDAINGNQSKQTST